MKCLLVALNAKYIHSNPALYSLRAYAKKQSPEKAEHIQIVEYTINHQKEQILADLYMQKPDMIAFSCYIWNWSIISSLLPEIAKLLPDVPLWLGGPEVSFEASQLISQFPMITGIMIGEGEETFFDLLTYYVEKEHNSLEHIKGLVLKSGATAPRLPMDMNSIPFLYDSLDDFNNRIIYYESSRGCPFRCSYCLSSIDKQVRCRDLEIVKKELQFFLDHNVAQVKFVDRTFNCNHTHAMEIWTYIQKNDNKVTNFHFEISADLITEEEIELLQTFRPGLCQLEIGVQSTNPQTIKEIHRSMNVERLREVVKTIKKGNNIHQHLDLIAGLPFEDYDTFVKSFNEVFEMEPDQLQLGFLKVLKGSFMHENAKHYGMAYLGVPPYEILYTKWLPYEKVIGLKHVEEMVERYYNSNQFTHILPVLINMASSPFELFYQLAQYYEEKGYFTTSPSRTYRYVVLLEFAVLLDPTRKELFQELLTYDLYLREKVKSRPEFASNMEMYKQRIRTFYKNELEHPKYLLEYDQEKRKQISKMTHIEIFHYPVWDVSRCFIEKEQEVKNSLEVQHMLNIKGNQDIQKIQPHEYAVMFDYNQRNPLTYEARNWLISL